MDNKIHPVCIIGSGPAGYTAAIYAGRSKLKPLLFQGKTPGGQLTITTDVENYPGFSNFIQGPQLMKEMEIQSAKCETVILSEEIAKIDFSSYPYKMHTTSGKSYLTQSIIIATGAEAKWLGLKNEQELLGYGISGCATCDGFFFQDQDVMVVGGGNTAAEEALFLTQFAKKVILVHRKDTLRADPVLQEKVFNSKKIEILWNHEVSSINPNREIKANDPKTNLKLSTVTLLNNLDDSTKDLPIDGLFIAIGHTPNTNIFSPDIKVDKDQYIITAPDSTKTNLPGVFAAGDVKDKIFRQAITSAGMGCMAAIEAYHFLESKKQ